MSRPLIIEIDLSALQRNYARLKQQHRNQHVLAVLKANAYGHGAVACARALAAADGFAVASLEEAETLRAAGISQPILLIEGVFEAGEWARVAALDLWAVVHAEHQLQWLKAHFAEAPPPRPLQIWLKMNSGMQRVGFTPQAWQDALAQVLALDCVGEIVAMTHFAQADETDLSAARAQWQRFASHLPEKIKRSACNSAALFSLPEAHGDVARAGILLYGLSPFAAPVAGFEPVMRVKSQIIAVQTLQAGDVVGYGGTFVAPEAMRIGIVACGYADGYPRLASTGTPVGVLGQRTQIIGRVSMDMLAVDLRGIAAADVGSPVELWGSDILATEVASSAHTIAYECICNIKRGKFSYLLDEKMA